MKKGTKLSDVQYYLEIKDIRYNYIFSAGGLSLREAVRTAAEHVADMDNYSKVYRELKAMQGAFAGLYLAPGKSKKPRHAFVIIAEYEKPSSEDEQIALDEADHREGLIASGQIRPSE